MKRFSSSVAGQFSRHQAPLDQDNAHLILAEAVINSTASGKVRPFLLLLAKDLVLCARGFELKSL